MASHLNWPRLVVGVGVLVPPPPPPAPPPSPPPPLRGSVPNVWEFTQDQRRGTYIYQQDICSTLALAGTGHCCIRDRNWQLCDRNRTLRDRNWQLCDRNRTLRDRNWQQCDRNRTLRDRNWQLCDRNCPTEDRNWPTFDRNGTNLW